jgi:cytoskeletal protein CcmA (bactofilin family)
MFSPKKPETAAVGTTGAEPIRPASSPSYTAPASASAQSFSTYDRSTPANHSIVDERLTMKGDLESDGDVLVKGKVIGNIRCKLLIIDVDALVEGGIECDELVVRGRTKGTIVSTKVRLEKSASVDSEICHQSFSAEEGARIKGALKYLEEMPVSKRGTSESMAA